MLAYLGLRGFAATVYTKEQVLKPLINRGFKNALEMLRSQPQYGVGAKLRKRTWTEDCYYTVTQVAFKDPRCGKVFGTLTWKGKAETEELRISGVTKLGTWKYEPRPKPIKPPASTTQTPAEEHKAQAS